jgi:purine-nucleoside phosphorylase
MTAETRIQHSVLEQALKSLRNQWPKAKPACGLILGSGWSDVVESFKEKGHIEYEKIPGLGKTGVVGHSGRLVWGEAEGLETFVFQGRRHWYEGEGWTPVALPLFVLKSMGVKVVMLTNAAGGIRPDLKPGSLMIIDDHINNMAANPLLGPHNAFWGARFPDQSEVYDRHLRLLLENAGRAVHENIARGVYLAGSGPMYETPAEIKSFQSWGADAVGMSTIPEALLGHAAGMRMVALSCITNSAAGISEKALSHEEVTDTTKSTMPRMKAVIAQFWKELAREGV